MAYLSCLFKSQKKDLGMFKIKQNFNDEEFYNIAA